MRKVNLQFGSPQHGGSAPTSALLSWAPLAAGLVVSALLLQPSDTVQAGILGSIDTDGDGLYDLQEIVIGTRVDAPDTDFDGFSDAEEVARQTDPSNNLEAPVVMTLNVGLKGRADNGVFTTMTAVYLQGGLANQFFEFGFYLGGGQLIPIPMSSYRPASMIRSIPAADPNDVILIIETAFPESVLHALGNVSFYCQVMDRAPGAGPTATAASVLNAFSFSGVPVAQVPSPQGMVGGTGVVYRPLGDGTNVPTNWTSGQVCWQATAPVGSNGPAVIYEIESTNCEDLDTYCEPMACAALVGGTVEVLDAGSLLGG